MSHVRECIFAGYIHRALVSYTTWYGTGYKSCAFFSNNVCRLLALPIMLAVLLKSDMSFKNELPGKGVLRVHDGFSQVILD